MSSRAQRRPPRYVRTAIQSQQVYQAILDKGIEFASLQGCVDAVIRIACDKQINGECPPRFLSCNCLTLSQAARSGSCRLLWQRRDSLISTRMTLGAERSTLTGFRKLSSSSEATIGISESKSHPSCMSYRLSPAQSSRRQYESTCHSFLLMCLASRVSAMCFTCVICDSSRSQLSLCSVRRASLPRLHPHCLSNSG